MAAIARALPFISAGFAAFSALGQMQAGKAAAMGLGQQAAMAARSDCVGGMARP